MELVGNYTGKIIYFKNNTIKTYHIIIDDYRELSKLGENINKIDISCILDDYIKCEPYLNQYVLIKYIEPFGYIIKLFFHTEIDNYFKNNYKYNENIYVLDFVKDL